MYQPPNQKTAVSAKVLRSLSKMTRLLLLKYKAQMVNIIGKLIQFVVSSRNDVLATSVVVFALNEMRHHKEIVPLLLNSLLGSPDGLERVVDKLRLRNEQIRDTVVDITVLGIPFINVSTTSVKFEILTTGLVFCALSNIC
jgi:hypothetical protein